MELNHTYTLITSDKLEEALKLTKNRTSTGEDNINSELLKNTLENFKLRLLQFFNKYKQKIVFQMNSEMPF
jgi:hypothetical protein